MTLKFTTTQLNGKTEQVIYSNISQKEGLYYGLEKRKGSRPFCVTFGSEEIYRGFGYTIEEAINNATVAA